MDVQIEDVHKIICKAIQEGSKPGCSVISFVKGAVFVFNLAGIDANNLKDKAAEAFGINLEKFDFKK